jgi:hypothetical protein
MRDVVVVIKPEELLSLAERVEEKEGRGLPGGLTISWVGLRRGVGLAIVLTQNEAADDVASRD